jgi:hypothetical protein
VTGSSIGPGPPGDPRLTDPQAGFLAGLADDLNDLVTAAGGAGAVDWHEELTLRDRLLGAWPSERRSATGACRILPSADGWIAITIARSWDHEVLPALVEGPVGEDHWETVARWAAGRSSAAALERARLLDMAAASFESIPADTPVPLRSVGRWPRRTARPLGEVQVVDLSSLWAGPLAARILAEAGATVTKIESVYRPDGARQMPALYSALHTAEQPNVVVDLSSAGGRARLHELVETADVVIEASRPRALQQLGSAPDQVRSKAGRVWLSITGYGRRGPGANWVAFGDDAAVAGGLTAWTEAGEPAFCADAVADPVTGLFGAAAVLRSLAAGGGHLIDLPLAGAAAAVARAGGRGPAEPSESMWPS